MSNQRVILFLGVLFIVHPLFSVDKQENHGADQLRHNVEKDTYLQRLPNGVYQHVVGEIIKNVPVFAHIQPERVVRRFVSCTTCRSECDSFGFCAKFKKEDIADIFHVYDKFKQAIHNLNLGESWDAYSIVLPKNVSQLNMLGVPETEVMISSDGRWAAVCHVVGYVHDSGSSCYYIDVFDYGALMKLRSKQIHDLAQKLSIPESALLTKIEQQCMQDTSGNFAEDEIQIMKLLKQKLPQEYLQKKEKVFQVCS